MRVPDDPVPAPSNEPDRDADGRERGEVSDWAAFDEFSERQKSAHRHEVPPDTPLPAARRLKGVGRGHRVLPILAVGGSPWRLRGVIPRKKARRGGGRPPGPKRSLSSPARARRSSSSRSPLINRQRRAWPTGPRAPPAASGA